LISCTTDAVPDNNTGDSWSVKTANSVISSNDSLINYNNTEKIKWQYDIAMVGQAIDRLGAIDKKYSHYLEEFINYFVQEDGSVIKYKQSDYNLDHINPAKNLITLYKRTGDDKYLKAINGFIHQLEMQPRTPSGGFWHKKIYPNQMWLDGIYMSSPFMAQYAAEFNDPGWFDTLSYQIKLIWNKTRDPQTGLLYHAWDESKTQKWSDPVTGVSPNFWSRSIGWFMMALVDVLDYLPETHPERDSIIYILNETAEAVVNARDAESKLWYQVTDQGNREGNYLEASGSAMFVYSLAKAANKNYIDRKYYNIAQESYTSILETFIDTTGDEIIMKNICGGCGLGGNPYRDGSFEYYVNEKQVDNDPKGVGAFIMASIELKR
jgi:unsaturated rhamnogalacturonyl hydrolase